MAQSVTFAPAVRRNRLARVAIVGPSGSGKTMTALILARLLAQSMNRRIAVLCTERGSASLYAGEVVHGEALAFDTAILNHFAPDDYLAAFQAAGKARYDALVIDSLSHAWIGVGSIMDQRDHAKSEERFSIWQKLTPQQRRLMDGVTSFPGHVVATMRTAGDYVQEEYTAANGQKRTKIVKVGTKPIQREELEYEFDLYARMELDNSIRIEKTRCSAMLDKTAIKPGPAYWQPFVDWLNSAEPPPPPPDPAELAPEDLVWKLHRLLRQEPKKAWVAALKHLGITAPADFREPNEPEEVQALTAWLFHVDARKLLDILTRGGRQDSVKPPPATSAAPSNGHAPSNASIHSMSPEPAAAAGNSEIPF